MKSRIRQVVREELNRSPIVEGSGKLPSSVERFFANFPDDAVRWDDATDELMEMAHEMRELYNDIDLDLRDSEPGAYPPLNFRAMRSPSQRNTEAKKYMRKLWALMGSTSKRAWLKHFKQYGWL